MYSRPRWTPGITDAPVDLANGASGGVFDDAPSSKKNTVASAKDDAILRNGRILMWSY
jgi:hypothetical protein